MTAHALLSIVQAHLDATGVSEAEFSRRIGAAPQTVNSWRNRGVRSLPSRRLLEGVSTVTGHPYPVVLRAALADTGYEAQAGAATVTALPALSVRQDRDASHFARGRQAAVDQLDLLARTPEGKADAARMLLDRMTFDDTNPLDRGYRAALIDALPVRGGIVSALMNFTPEPARKRRARRRREIAIALRLRGANPPALQYFPGSIAPRPPRDSARDELGSAHAPSRTTPRAPSVPAITTASPRGRGVAGTDPDFVDHSRPGCC